MGDKSVTKSWSEVCDIFCLLSVLYCFVRGVHQCVVGERFKWESSDHNEMNNKWKLFSTLKSLFKNCPTQEMIQSRNIFIEVIMVIFT